MLTASELALIDDWRFVNRIATRAEAVRRLLIAGMVSDLKPKERARIDTSVRKILTESKE